MVGACLLLAACAAGAATAKATPAVRLGTNPMSPSNSFVWVAQEAGLFPAAGVDVDVQGLGGGQRMNALVAGQIDGEAGAGAQEFVAARANGTDLTMIAAFSAKFDDVLLVPNEITSMEQLRGKAIGSVTTTSVDVHALTMYMRQFGWEQGRDYKVVGVGANASQAGPAAAMTAHQVEAAVLQQDFARGVVAQGGFHVLVDFGDTDLRQPGLPLDFRTDFIRQRPDLVQRTLDALIQSVRYAREHPAETKTLIAEHMKIDDAAHVDALYDREIALWQKAPIIDRDALARAVDFVSQSSPAARNLEPNQLIDARFVDDAIKRGLTNY
jgi:ABC-type nitrate/sulfonate/bicarbonate transport system substrate-binding protein